MIVRKETPSETEPLSEQGQTPGKRTEVGEEEGERWGDGRAREKSSSEKLNPGLVARLCLSKAETVFCSAHVVRTACSPYKSHTEPAP